MENKILKGGGYLAMGLILFVATLIIIRWAIDFATWSRLSAADTGTWVGAIGVVGTLIGTIHLARVETQQRERREKTVARLRGAGMAARIEHALQQVFIVLTMLHFAREGDRKPTDYAHCKETLEEIEFWTIEEVIELAPLPFNVAIKLAEVVDHVHTVKGTLDRMSRMAIISAQYQRTRVEGMTKILDLTVQYLDDAKRECRLGAVKLQLNVH